MSALLASALVFPSPLRASDLSIVADIRTPSPLVGSKRVVPFDHLTWADIDEMKLRPADFKRGWGYAQREGMRLRLDRL